MISKELLSEVFGEKRVILDYEVSINKTEIHYGHKDIDEDGFINIYELANKCKEWAYKQGFIIDSGFHKNYINQFKANCYGWVSSNIDINKNFNKCTEVEAIIEACQWILDNKEQK